MPDSPLHIAVRNGNFEIAKILLDNGVDHNAKNDEGKTPLDIAVERGDTNLVTLLTNSAAKTMNTASPKTSVPPQSAPQAPIQQPAEKRSVQARKEQITLWAWIFVVIFAFNSIFFYNGALLDKEDLGVGAALFLFLFVIAQALALFFYLRKCWEEVPAPFASMTPNYAAGLTLIPFFCYYWYFKAVLGFLQDMNKYLVHHQYEQVFDTHKVKIVCIFWAASEAINLLSVFAEAIFGGRPGGILDILPYVNLGVTVWAIYFISGKACEFIERKRKMVYKSRDILEQANGI